VRKLLCEPNNSILTWSREALALKAQVMKSAECRCLTKATVVLEHFPIG
jgi:hypothetical protein